MFYQKGIQKKQCYLQSFNISKNLYKEYREMINIGNIMRISLIISKFDKYHYELLLILITFTHN
jgi:hypothetical protein